MPTPTLTEGRVARAVDGRAGPAGADRPTPLAHRGDDYTSSVSHEVRTSLAIILGYTELLWDLDAGPLTQCQRAMLEKVQDSATRVQRMVQSMLHGYPGAQSPPTHLPATGPPSRATGSR